jgi:ribosomal protein S17E
MLTQGATVKVRNQIAGYITHALAGMTMASPSNQEGEKGE